MLCHKTGKIKKKKAGVNEATSTIMVSSAVSLADRKLKLNGEANTLSMISVHVGSVCNLYFLMPQDRLLGPT